MRIIYIYGVNLGLIVVFRTRSSIDCSPKYRSFKNCNLTLNIEMLHTKPIITLLSKALICEKIKYFQKLSYVKKKLKYLQKLYVLNVPSQLAT